MNNSKEKLNDELLDQVSGGVLLIQSDDYIPGLEEGYRYLYACFSRVCRGGEFITESEVSVCPNCGSTYIEFYNFCE